MTMPLTGDGRARVLSNGVEMPLLGLGVWQIRDGMNDGQAKRYVSVTIFGDERCPTSNDPETIVVCRKGDPDRQFRIPSDLRSIANPTSNRTWGQRSRDVRTAGRSGPMSCSPVGPAGQSGCWADMMENWAADRTGNTGDGVVSPVEDN